MKVSKDILTSFLLVIVFGILLGCTHQEVRTSPCVTLHATFDIKPRTDLALAFGNDAIRAAVDAVTKGFAKEAITSVSNLTELAKNAAVRTATAKGKTPTLANISELEKYLSDDVVPAMRQNPACTFTVSSGGKPYIGIEDVAFLNMADKQIPALLLRNTGQMEAHCHIDLKLILDGKASSALMDLRLGPSQARTISFEEVNLPMADIETGKASILISVAISYSYGAGEPPVTSQETWQYKPATKHFIVVSQE